MLRSLYIAGTGMLTQRRQLDVITNNIANADTTGYKSDRTLSHAFDDMLIERLDDPNILSSAQGIGRQNTGVYIDAVFTDYTQGALEETGRAADLAIEGEGYFCLTTPDGTMYTRDGAFSISPAGYLANLDGYPLQGENGQPIYVGTDAFSLDADGVVTVDGAVRGRVRLVSFADEGALRKAGGNLYYNYGGSAATPGGGRIRQGYLEGSNVDITGEMVRMIEVSRRYETNQRMVQMIDESLGKAVNEVGRV